MKTRKHPWGLVVLLLTAILLQGCPPEEIEVPEEDKRAEILNEKIEAAVTLEAMATLKKFGMPIHDGVQPPNIEGSYLADDITLKVCKNIEDCSPVGTKYAREKWTLKNQDNERFSVNLLIENENDDKPDSYNMIISGEGNKFTLYNGKTGLSSEGNAYRIIDVYSGTMTENGLTNVHFATLWIEEGYNDAAMIYHEQDGMAKKFDGPLEPEKPEPEPGEKAGSVKLPQGAKVDFEKYSVASFSDKQKMTKKGDFVVGIDESEQLQQTVFMADGNNRVLMLAYLNVGTEKIELSAESSAIGIFMMLTGARSQVDKEQWTRTEELLKKTPKFAPVLAEVERLIKEEADLLSEDNTRLIELYGELLNSMAPAEGGSTTKGAWATRGTSGSTSQLFTQTPSRGLTQTTSGGAYQPFTQSSFHGVTQSLPQTRADDDDKDVSLPPLVITNEGSRIIINNNGTAAAYDITIEEEKEDGKRQEVLRQTLGVSRAVNLGIGDILTWNAGFFQPPPLNVEYNMRTNTNYYFSAISGLDTLSSATAMNILEAIFYLGDGLGWSMGEACLSAITERMVNNIKGISDMYAMNGLGDAVMLFAKNVIDFAGSGSAVECLMGKDIEELASKVAKFVYKGLDVLGKTCGYSSLYAHFFFWLTNEPMINFCRSTDGVDLNECGMTHLTITTPLPIGTRVRLKCDRHACVFPAWIDLNGNDKKDPDEELEDGYNDITLLSQKMKIHGDFAELDFEEMELTLISLNQNSQVQYISAEKLKEFQGGECEQLKSFYTGTKLEKINVRNCKALEVLSIRSKLTELDLSGCKALEELHCSKNELYTLDLRGLKKLKKVDCYSNRLTKVQLEDNEALVNIDLRYNLLDSTNIAGIVKNLPQREKKDKAIIKLDDNTAIPSGNDYKSANLKNWTMTPAAGKLSFTTAKPVGSTIRLTVTSQETNPYDVWVDLNGNGEMDEGESFSTYGTPQEFKVARDTVTIHGGLLKVDCSNNDITWLEAKKCPTLQELRCNKNKIEELSINDLLNLKLLDCSDNLLKNLTIAYLNLTELYCKNNPVTEAEIVKCEKLEVLDVSNCASMTKLNCNENNLKTLTLTGCNALKTLNCYNNSLTALNVSGKTNLSKLDCRNNLLDASTITKVITDLPQRAEGDNAFANFEGNQAVPTAQDAKTAKTKNWTIIPIPEGEGPDDPDDPDNPLPNGDVIVFTTDKLDGTLVFITSLPGTEENIWIDWNDSGIQDEGEELFYNNLGTYPYYYVLAGIPSVKTLKIHGASFITDFKIVVEEGVNIVSIDIRKGVALRELAFAGSLETLHVKGNTGLQSLTVLNSQLTSLDLTGCTALRSVSISNNGGITSLNLTGCTALRRVSVSNNASLTSLNLTGCTALENLRVTDNNLLTSIKLTDCKALNVFDIYKINEMVSLDLTDCAALSKLNCSHCKIDYLNASGLKKLETIFFYDYDDTAPVQNSIGVLNLSNCTSLEQIYFDDVRLASLDVSGCTALKYLTCCAKVGLNNLNLSGCTALIGIDIEHNYLTYLDISTCNQLKSLLCGNNELTSLDLSTCNQLSFLGCGYNELTSLDLSNCPKLEYVSCDSNRISSLKLSGYKTLKRLYCSDNKLTSLNLSEYTALEMVFCHNNQLTSLLVSGNDREEFYIGCWSNRIRGNGMEALINSLPDVKEGVLRIIDLSDSNEANVCTKNQVQTAKSKGWRVMDEKQNDYSGS